jgi:tetratricopeptide (TPR) repeat protein
VFLLPPRQRRGFILLFGTRTIVSADAAAEPLNTVCPNCGQEAELVGKKYRNWFTLFFIPIFPISGAQRLTQCTRCNAQFRVGTHELRSKLANTEQQQSQEAIGLYNSLRASPANSITLDQLMKMYASMKEYDQAISAASNFPQALHNSEQCMTTLGRVYLAKNEYPRAIEWFDAAVQRNPELGEAHYYRALSHMLTTPPDYASAIAAARAARAAGYPEAAELLKEAETKARGQA